MYTNEQYEWHSKSDLDNMKKQAYKKGKESGIKEGIAYTLISFSIFLILHIIEIYK